MSAHAAAAMSNAVLNSLNRLSDGHTRRTAWNELTAFAEQLDAQRLPGFLVCLHATNDRYTIACRRGAIQLYGRLGAMHPRLLPPHLPKIADYLVARLRDKDSTRELREACAAALGSLVAELGPDAPPVVLRYLLPVLGETLEPVQLDPMVAASLTYGCSLADMCLQPCPASLTYGCSLVDMWLQPI